MIFTLIIRFGTQVEDRSKNGLHGELHGGKWLLSGKIVTNFPSTLHKELKGLVNNPNFSDVRYKLLHMIDFI